jgi:hypothetical protein
LLRDPDSARRKGQQFAPAPTLAKDRGVSGTTPEPPRPRGARKRTLPTIRSPGPVFLGFAARSFRAAADAQGQPAPALTGFRALEQRTSALLFASCALEAHTVAVHQCFFARDLSTREILLWRKGDLVDRLADLLPKKVHSPRRQRLLMDVAELCELVRQPPPIRVAEQIDLFERTERPSGPEFWFGNTVWVRRDESRLIEDERHRPADLPADPLELTHEHLVTALLILLEHCVLLDRHFARWAEWPLATLLDGQVLTAATWFDELRRAYAGPHAAYFRRVVATEPDPA